MVNQAMFFKGSILSNQQLQLILKTKNLSSEHQSLIIRWPNSNINVDIFILVHCVSGNIGQDFRAFRGGFLWLAWFGNCRFSRWRSCRAVRDFIIYIFFCSFCVVYIIESWFCEWNIRPVFVFAFWQLCFKWTREFRLGAFVLGRVD